MSLPLDANGRPLLGIAALEAALARRVAAGTWHHTPDGWRPVTADPAPAPWDRAPQTTAPPPDGAEAQEIANDYRDQATA